MHNPGSRIILSAVALLLVLPAMALAEDAPEKTRKSHVVIGDEIENITINTEGSELVITMTEGGQDRMAVLDLDQVGMMVGESLSGLGEMLAGMQFQMRLGQDNNFNLAVDDQEWELDLDAIMSEVGEALGGALADLETEGWATHHRRNLVAADEADLERELDDLRRELRELKKELARLERVKAENADR
jgi:hypothetical protein